jgi:alanine racemase
MDVTVVNITGVPDVGRGDIATLIGTDGDARITLDEVAGLAGTISYEVLTGLTPRIPRIWKGLDGS